jgi:hypothetical protein
MQGKKLQFLIAVAVFFGLQLIFFGVGEGRIYTAVATTLVFGLIYAAIIAGLALFRRDDRN